MGINIAGAVEVRGAHPKGMEQYWSRFATLETVYLRSRYIYDTLFGVYADDGGTETPLFADRGLPDDMTDETREEHERWTIGQLSGATLHDSWFTWDEAEAWYEEWENGIDTDYLTARAEYNWAVMFRVIDELSSFYGATNVRVVAWFAY
ncbi:MAG: hypothetical protein ACXWQ5_00440 [Ktedonobacterales bacterium]